MKTQNELLDQGYKALVDVLGVVDAIRFIQYFSPGYGDYTKERHQWLDQLTRDDFIAEIRKHKQADDGSKFEEIIE